MSLLECSELGREKEMSTETAFRTEKHVTKPTARESLPHRVTYTQQRETSE